MSNPDPLVLQRYDALLVTNLTAMAESDTLRIIGELVDLASDRSRTDGLALALKWSTSLARRPLTPQQEMTLQYFRGNAWLGMYAQAIRSGGRTDSDWTQPELGQAVLALRSVIAHDGFGRWPAIRQAQLYTNLGNALSTLGRAPEAIEYRDRALSVVSTFGMGLGTRAESIDAFRSALWTRTDINAYTVAAAQGFTSATQPSAFFESTVYAAVIEKWSRQRDHLNRRLVGHSQSPLTLHQTGNDGEGSAYLSWCLGERLMLNPLNDLGTYQQAATDSLNLPPTAHHAERAEELVGFLDSMKQEFASSRWSVYEAIHAPALHFSDASLAPHNTGGSPVYGLWIERLKAAYRTTYSLFDKIAMFINQYFDVGMAPSTVSFSKIWNERPGVLRPLFETSRNWPLRGLYWIARDLSDPEFRDAMEPDAQAMAKMRNYLEHRFVRVVRSYPASERGADGVVYTVSRDDIARRAVALMKLARAALLALVCAVNVEERQRGRRATVTP